MDSLGALCAICNEDYWQHQAMTLHCPVFASFDRDFLAGYHYKCTFQIKEA